MQNGLPLRSLNEALHLGKLGTQTVLISEKAFRNLTFDGAGFADKTVILSLLQGILMREKRIEKKFVTDVLIKMIFLFWIFSERR